MVKPLAEFYVHTRRSGTPNVSPRCKPCHLTWTAAKGIERHGTAWAERLWKKYRLTPEMYAALLTKQEGLCAICKQKPPEHTDHDPVTGEVRGLLCRYCNTSLTLVERHLGSVLDYLGLGALVD